MVSLNSKMTNEARKAVNARKRLKLCLLLAVALVLSVGFTVWVTLIAWTVSRVQADLEKLDKIAKWSEEYVSELGEKRFYPKSLAELHEKMALDPGIFISPLDPDPPELASGFKCSFESCFDRYPNFRFTKGAWGRRVIMAWDRRPHSGWRCVVFFGYTVKRVRESQFQRLLADLDAFVKECTKEQLGREQPGKPKPGEPRGARDTILNYRAAHGTPY